MARKLSTREKIMVGGLVLAAIAFYRWQGGGIGFGAEPEKVAAKPPDFGTAPVVRMDLLAQGPTAFDVSGRNLFDYYTPPVKAPPRRPKPPPVARPKILPKPPPPPPPPRKLGPPAPKFHYLGFVGPKDGKIAAFDFGDEVFLARTGDEVQDSGLRLRAFRHEAVVLEYLDEQFKGQTTELQLKGLR